MWLEDFVRAARDWDYSVFSVKLFLFHDAEVISACIGVQILCNVGLTSIFSDDGQLAVSSHDPETGYSSNDSEGGRDWGKSGSVGAACGRVGDSRGGDKGVRMHALVAIQVCLVYSLLRWCRAEQRARLMDASPTVHPNGPSCIQQIKSRLLSHACFCRLLREYILVHYTRIGHFFCQQTRKKRAVYHCWLS